MLNILIPVLSGLLNVYILSYGLNRIYHYFWVVGFRGGVLNKTWLLVWTFMYAITVIEVVFWAYKVFNP